MAPLQVEWLGRVPYADALELQREVLEARREAGAVDRLLLLEHPAVVTLGRSTKPENLRLGPDELRARGIERHEISRGGDVTYHAPGQLVGYLIRDLRAAAPADAAGAQAAPDLHVFLRTMETALIDALSAAGLAGRRVEGRTGVFMDASLTRGGPDRKIASIGIGVRHWITYHGFALNVSVDLSGFDVIVPCGLADVEMTSVAAELERAGAADDAFSGLDTRVRQQVSASFERHFG